MKTRLLLQNMCNKYGDFKVARATIDPETGEPRWSKHRSVLELWHEDWGLEFLDEANNRQILLNELVIDIDEPPYRDNCDKVCDWLDKENITYSAYHTGSKGYHIHIFGSVIAEMTQQRRKEFRKWVLKACGADELKNSENVMIAIEGASHWKTGNPKVHYRGKIWD